MILSVDCRCLEIKNETGAAGHWLHTFKYLLKAIAKILTWETYFFSHFSIFSSSVKKNGKRLVGKKCVKQWISYCGKGNLLVMHMYKNTDKCTCINRSATVGIH